MISPLMAMITRFYRYSYKKYGVFSWWDVWAGRLQLSPTSTWSHHVADMYIGLSYPQWRVSEISGQVDSGTGEQYLCLVRRYWVSQPAVSTFPQSLQAFFQYCPLYNVWHLWSSFACLQLRGPSSDRGVRHQGRRIRPLSVYYCCWIPLG